MTNNINKSLFRFFYLLGTPLTSFNGRITRNARKDLTSKPWTLYCTNTTLKNLSHPNLCFYFSQEKNSSPTQQQQ
jgi:hypothetical protein